MIEVLVKLLRAESLGSLEMYSLGGKTSCLKDDMY